MFDNFIKKLVAVGMFPILYVLSYYVGRKKQKTETPRLLWGVRPIKNFMYWSNSFVREGYISKTFMENFYSINKKEDFDLYPDTIFKYGYYPVIRYIRPYVCFIYGLMNFDIIHISFDGFFLRMTPLKCYEHLFFKRAKIKTVILGYGGDYYVYSKINDSSLRHALLISYPDAGRNENEIEKQFKYWSRHADIVVAGPPSVDGWGRWDVLTCNMVSINEIDWKPKTKFSNLNGTNGEVNIAHTPNHRGFKGSEFVIEAVNELKREGLKINLILIENKPNEEVKRILAEEADILLEQLICVAYALSGIEGMASALPVISNQSDPRYTQLFRRYSFLSECPIISATPESIKEVLRMLIVNPELRKEIGLAGRKYIEKYHSEVATRFMFTQIYRKIWKGEDVDLINIYHPLNPDSYNNQSPKIEHPLIENKIPEALLNTLNK